MKLNDCTVGSDGETGNGRGHHRLQPQRRMGPDRDPQQEDGAVLHVLSRAVRRHHLHDPHSPADALLLLQPDRTFRAHLVHGFVGFHSAARFGRETHLR